MKKLVTAAALAVAAPLVVTTTAHGEATQYAPYFTNCTAMRRIYPHGVGLFGAHDHTSGTPVTNFARRPRVYRANTGLDRDKDHIACEAH